jgi:pyrroline-5-carboxylate reductase
MQTAKITIIGAGNMGASLLGGLVKNGYSPDSIWITDPDTNKLDQLKREFNVKTTTNNLESIQSADVIILAVKPQILNQVATGIASFVQSHKPLVLSIAAGVRVDSIQHWLGEGVPIVRAMPNTPALLGCGATALYPNRYVSEKQHNLAESMLRSVGMVVWVDNEKHMDIITALSGSGPAYFFLIMEAMQNAAHQLGLPKDVANSMTLQTAYGAARMALESSEDVVKLRHNVTSPGGTTEQAVRVLEDENIRHIFAKAINKATQRAEELAEILGNTMEK